MIVTSDFEISKVAAPRLPSAPLVYNVNYQEQYSNILRLYFNRLENILGQLVATIDTLPVSIGGTNVDAFGRVRVSEPYTLFDSQNRYAIDTQYDTALTGTGATSYQVNESAVNMNLTAGGVGSVVRQTFCSFPYQPGKGLLVLATFCMDASPSLDLTQRVGYFNTQNGVFFQRIDGTNAFVLRSYVTGTASDARTVDQGSWNGDKLDGTGPSGITLDSAKSQILWMDFEWLGVGSVRCGFIINGEYIVCHTFTNANEITATYMTTAILPVRYEITSTSAVAATLKQICSSVMSEGGYNAQSANYTAARTTKRTTFSTTFIPLISIRLATGRLGAVVLLTKGQAFPTVTQNYEVVILKNATLTGPSWGATVSSNVEFDQTATALTGGVVVDQEYISATSQNKSAARLDVGYNWDLQLGGSLAGVSDTFTLAIRTLDATPSGDAWGAISFYDLTTQ
jgi:hypothetical protein